MKKVLFVLVCLFALLVAGKNSNAQEVTITLVPGWNWISCPATDTLDFATALDTFTPTSGDVIKSLLWGTATYTNNRWRGGISKFYPGYGYMYKSNRTESVALTFHIQQSASQVTVTTMEPTDITTTSAVIGGTVTLGEGNHLFARGICWGMEPNPTIDGNQLVGETVGGEQSFTLDELIPGTTYYIRAYVVTDIGLDYGNELSFTTIDNIVFADANVKAICVEHWDTNGDGELSYAEAAAVTSLNNVFAQNENITSFNELQYFTGLTTLNGGEFYLCYQLAQIIIPNTVTTIGGGVLHSCSITSITIPQSVTSIAWDVFNWASSLEQIIVEEGNAVYDSRENCNAIVETSSNKIFIGCKNTTYPTSITSIAESAFFGDRSGASVTIPNHIIDIQGNPFMACTGLEQLTVESGNPVYDSRDDCNAIIETNTNTLISGCKNTVIPNTVTTIGRASFYQLYGSLNSIVIPSLVTIIGSGAFVLTDLSSVEIYAENPPAMTETAFEGSSMFVYIPCGSLEAYQNAEGWSEFANFIEMCPDHAYVDLGLPSGLLWATCNIGADNPEDYGDYFAWGETTTKDTYNWSTYQYCNGSSNTLTKYCNNSSFGYNGFTDNLTTLLPEDDAATANWGEGWRIPTKEEWQELYNNTTVAWTTQNGVNGRLFTASNGNSIFLPAAGHLLESGPFGVGSGGWYWSSSLNMKEPIYAWDFHFNADDYYMDYFGLRCTNRSIRPVREGSQSTSYVIDATVNPAEGGTIVGTGSYEQGQTCTLTATANSGYTFVNWTENDEEVSIDATYTFTVTSDRTLVANFTANVVGDHAYVDLGLPSGLLWATCNVGADNPEDYGDYFAWGETLSKDTYNWSSYQYCMGSGFTMTKYCGDAGYGYNGFTDDLTTLLPEDDAATANWGGDWRMPTPAEFQELLDNTTVTWTTQNGVNGRLFTGSNGNSLFLPAAGYRLDDELDDVGSLGYYWSSSLSTNYPYNAWTFYFRSGDCYVNYGNRLDGLSVRAVRSAHQN